MCTRKVTHFQRKFIVPTGRQNNQGLCIAFFRDTWGGSEALFSFPEDSAGSCTQEPQDAAGWIRLNSSSKMSPMELVENKENTLKNKNIKHHSLKEREGCC